MILREALNLTNATLSRSRRHYSYVGELNEDKCATIRDTPYEKRVEFFLRTDDCEDEGVIPYKKLMYFYLNPQSKSAEIGYLFVYLLCLAYIFIILGTVTDK